MQENFKDFLPSFLTSYMLLGICVNCPFLKFLICIIKKISTLYLVDQMFPQKSAGGAGGGRGGILPAITV